MKWILHLLLLGTIALAAVSEPDRALFSPSRNLLPNGGFENGKTGWTASGGTFQTTTSSSNVGYGNMAVTWTASAAAQTLASSVIPIPPGMYGRNGVASCLIKGSGATHKLQVTDGTNILSSVSITSMASYARTNVNFIYPSSGGVSLQLQSVAVSEPQIYIDDCFIQPADAYNLSQVGQAKFLGSVVISGSGWVSSTTGSPQAFPAASSATYTVTGVLQPSSVANAPGFNISNIGPGIISVTAIGAFNAFGSGANAVGSFAISDGTTVSTTQTMGGSFNAGPSANTFNGIVKGDFQYTSSMTNVNYQIYGAPDSASSVSIGSPVEFDVYYYPSSSQVAFNPDQSPQSWSGYQINTGGGWTTTNTSFGDFTPDSSVTLTQTTNRNFGSVTSDSSNRPGITFQPAVAGVYHVCAFVDFVQTTSGNPSARLVDGNGVIIHPGITISSSNNDQQVNLCGDYQVVSSGSPVTVLVQGAASVGTALIQPGVVSGTASIQWQISNADTQNAAPILVNSVTTSNQARNHVESYDFYCGNTGSTMYYTTDSGATVSNATNPGTCTIAFGSGTFTGNVVCSCTLAYGGPVYGSCALQRGANYSGTALVVNANGTTQNSHASMICMGSY